MCFIALTKKTCDFGSGCFCLKQDLVETSNLIKLEEKAKKVPTEFWSGFELQGSNIQFSFSNVAGTVLHLDLKSVLHRAIHVKNQDIGVKNKIR